ncbi:MAG: HAD family hydrolase [Thermoanaerobaculia bacterium]
MAVTQLLLFDIDGTLLSIAKRELNVFGRALETIFDTSGPLDGYSFAGKTDHQIAFDLLSRAGRSEREIQTGLPAMKEHYFAILDEMLTESSMKVLPGVVEILDELVTVRSAIVGLQTGNWRGAADIKLSRYGLDGYFEVGAFGDEQPDRSRLPLLARNRAEESTGRAIEAEQTVIIGDTALDVACAKACGMASVGVATGSTSQDELRGAGADLVVSSLAEIDADSLLGLTR